MKYLGNMMKYLLNVDNLSIDLNENNLSDND